MTAAEIKAARVALGLSQSGLAEALRMGPNGERQVRRWEQGETPVSGPASVAIELLLGTLSGTLTPGMAENRGKADD
jgi:DNA-binding transcriptional regulator YiaG